MHRSLILLLTLDSIALVFDSLHFIPLFVNSGRTINIQLGVKIAQLAIKTVIIKLSVTMLLYNSYRIASLICYIMRLLVVCLSVTEVCVYQSINDTFLSQTNLLFLYLITPFMVYNMIGSWINLSVFYWAEVMITKNRTLVVLKNLLPTDSNVPKLKVRVHNIHADRER